jgi:hypothetical protein
MLGVERELHIMPATTSSLIWLCSECKAEIDESEWFAFGGTVACENCVNRYYQKNNAVDPHIQWDVELELRTRRRAALEWLRLNRKTIEKQQATLRECGE